MSGGVDSSVAAALLQETGYEVIGVSMQLWCEEKHGTLPSRPVCCSIQDINDARQVCHILDIPFYMLNLEEEFQAHVVDYFCHEYARGRTPNPCIACNKWIKFDLLLRRVLSLGVEYLATGHYARIETSGNEYRLFKGVDPSSDQSYFLYTLGQGELPHLLFPLGNYRKTEVRHIAAERGLPVANKPKSQDLCFIPNGDYRDFLKEYIPSLPGKIIDTQGKVLGNHQGIAFYTVGQRSGLGLASGKRLYVVAIEADSNRLVVGSEAELFLPRLRATEVSFVGKKPPLPIAIKAKIRHKSPESEAMLYAGEDGVEVRFKQPQRIITPGQAVVFYRDAQVLGGGIIEAS